MAKTYYTVLTTYGAQLFAQAMANRQQVRITQFAVGDGNGRAVQPDSARTSLVRQVHRANISAISNDPRNNRQVIFELTIPENVGGFWIREMGIYDNNNRLVAYANCPDTYKPQLSEGSGKIQVVRMILLVSSSNAVTLSIDNSVIFVTRGQLTPKNITATSQNGVDETGHTHAIDHASLNQKGIVQLDNATDSSADNKAATPKAVKTVKELTDGKVAKSGDTMTGILEIDKGDSYVRGKVGRTNKWYVGKGSSSSDDITLWSDAYNSGVTLKSDRTEVTKPLYIDRHKVFHEGDYPEASDTRFGLVMLSHKTDGTDRTKAASVYALGEVRRLANQANVAIDGIALTWANVQQKPTTLSGFGITDAVSTNKVSNSVSSTSQTNVGSSLAVKTAYDKGTEAKTTADSALLTANNANANANAEGRVSKSGDVMTGTLEFQVATNQMIKGVKGGQNIFYLGVQRGSNDLTIQQFTYGTQLTWGQQGIYSNKNIYVNNNAVYHAGNLPRASLTQAGIARLSSVINSSDESMAATPKAVKIAYDKGVEAKQTADSANDNADGRVSKGGDTMTGLLTLNVTTDQIIKGAKNGQDIFYIGTPTSSQNLTFYHHIYGTQFTMGRRGIYSNKDILINDHTVYHDGNLSFVGAVMYFAMSSAPTGWLKANGAAVSRTTYAALFAKIGTTFGAGDGRTTFNLPDFRGEFIRGWDDGRNIDDSRRLGSWQKGSIFGVDSVDARSAIGVAIKNIRSSPPLKMYEGPNIIGGDQVTFDDVEHVGLRWSGSGGAWANRNQNDGEGGFWTRGNQRNIGENHFAAMSRPRNIALLACIKY